MFKNPKGVVPLKYHYQEGVLQWKNNLKNLGLLSWIQHKLKVIRKRSFNRIIDR